MLSGRKQSSRAEVLKHRFCIYGNITLDYIIGNGSVATRVGGGVYYSSLPILEEGLPVEVYSLGPYWLFEASGLSRYKSNSDYSTHPTVFRIEYSGESRIMEVLEVSPALTPRDVHTGLCVSVVNPVLGEIPPSLLKTIRAGSLILAGDIQGFVRARRKGVLEYEAPWPINQVIDYFDIIHMDASEALYVARAENIDEALVKLSKAIRRGLIVVTEGYRASYIVKPGRFIQLSGIRPKVVDKTGAGDYLLSATVIYLANGVEPEEAVARALDKTDEWLFKKPVNASSRATTLIN
ncbi:PfkB family carbohydrate kinase [Thermogladius sp. 4427co]|uniref:PfkB family carbohydrate kinase n=1 Tax=Thermogladius sp. 4427co TaxID=3450718 RepID=UPI003F7ABA84